MSSSPRLQAIRRVASLVLAVIGTAIVAGAAIVVGRRVGAPRAAARIGDDAASRPTALPTRPQGAAVRARDPAPVAARQVTADAPTAVAATPARRGGAERPPLPRRNGRRSGPGAAAAPVPSAGAAATAAALVRGLRGDGGTGQPPGGPIGSALGDHLGGTGDRGGEGRVPATGDSGHMAAIAMTGPAAHTDRRIPGDPSWPDADDDAPRQDGTAGDFALHYPTPVSDGWRLPPGTNGHAPGAAESGGPPLAAPAGPGTPTDDADGTAAGASGASGRQTTGRGPGVTTVLGTAGEALRRRSPGVLVASAVVVVVGAVAGLAITTAGRDDDTVGTDQPGSTDVSATPPTAAPAPAPAEAFAGSSERLELGGSFSYTGTAHAIDVSTTRPMRWLAVDLAVTGEAAPRAGRLHEVAVAPDGRAGETITVGPSVWGRQAPTRAELVNVTYQPVDQLSGSDVPRLGLALLPLWLGATTAPESTGVDATGRPTYRGTLPGEILGELVDGSRPVPADIVLTLDAAGSPAHVRLTSQPDGAALSLSIDIARIGEPVSIEPPPSG